MRQRTKGALSLQEALIIPLRDNNCIYRLRCSFSEGLFIKYHAGLENQFRVSQINLQPSSHSFPWDSRQQKHLTNVENAVALIYFSISSISNEEFLCEQWQKNHPVPVCNRCCRNSLSLSQLWGTRRRLLTCCLPSSTFQSWSRLSNELQPECLYVCSQVQCECFPS